MKTRFWVVFATVTLVIAGLVSYLASPSPDGLDSATMRGCDTVQTPSGEELTGNCIAQHATDHRFAGSPLADYLIGGRSGTGGLAGVAGVLVTLLIAGAVCWMIARRPRVRRNRR